MVKRREPEEVGKRLRELRGIRTRTGVSRETGIGVGSLQAYEEGRRTPRDATKAVLSNYYDVPVDQLFYTQE